MTLPRICSRENVLKLAEFLVVAICQYEAEAITRKKAPTVSSLCRARRPVEVALLAVLLTHLHVQLAEAVRELESCEWEASF